MVREAVGPEPGLNYWQKRTMKKRRRQETVFVYCLTCRRYRWAEIDNGRQRCLECGATVDKEES